MKTFIFDRDKYLKTAQESCLYAEDEYEGTIKRTITGVAAVAAIVLLGALIHGVTRADVSRDDKTTDDTVAVVTEDAAKPSNKTTDKTTDDTVAVVTEDAAKQSYPEIIRSNAPETYLVTKVVDGDTIYVSGISTRIRLIGVNTPETVDSSKPVQCYGPEASSYLTNLILNKYVSLESDAASGDLDRYERPLRYVYYNGENVNQKIILNGYGVEADYGSFYKYRDIFQDTEDYAAQNNLGLWSAATCGGSFQ